MVVVTQKDEGGIIPPAITVFPWSIENLGLKITIPENLVLAGGLVDMYENSGHHSPGTIQEWIEKSSYNYSEVLLDTTLGQIALKSLKDNWVEDVTQTAYGPTTLKISCSYIFFTMRLITLRSTMATSSWVS